MKGLVHVAQRDRDDRDPGVLAITRRYDPVARAARLDRVDRDVLADLQLCRDLGRRWKVLPVGDRGLAEQLPVGVAELAVGAGRKVDAVGTRPVAAVAARSWSGSATAP